jgi:hypothetical protein
MRDVTVEAKTGVGTDSEKSFSTTVNLPETAEEAIKSYGSEEVFKIWYGATIVRIQGNMRKPEGAKNTKTLDVYRKLRPLIDSGAMDDEQARDVSGYRGEWPVS